MQAFRLFRSFLVLCTVAASPALAAPHTAELLVADADATAFELGGEASGSSTAVRVEATGQPHAQALRVAVPEAVSPRWAVQVTHTVDAPIRAGDALLATFWLRCVESTTGEGQVRFDFEMNAEPHEKSLSQVLYAPAGWKRFQLPFEAGRDFPAGGSQAAFQVAFLRQTVELGGFTLENFGQGVSADELPRTRRTYPGMAEDAPWRAEAASRIDRIRKADLTVTVVDADGEPVEGAAVAVEMTGHAFPFGSAVTSEWLTREDAEGERYRELVDRLFSEVVLESDLKWTSEGWLPLGRIDAALAWLASRGKPVRGHCLVWPGWPYVPDRIEALADDPAALAAAVEQRIRSAASRYAGRVVDWDVVNEPHTNHDLQDLLGPGALADWFRLARAADPDAVLYLNDYGQLTAGERETPHQQAHLDHIAHLLEVGAPLGGIGLQGHFSAELTAPTTLWRILDRFAGFGLPIKVTEFDLNFDDPELQAAYLRDFFTAMFSHEAVDGVLMWGFWEKAHWRPQAALYNADFSPRPLGTAYEELILGDWWTDEAATTGADGTATVRGFLGGHRVTATHGGVTRTAAAELTAGGGGVEIRLPRDAAGG
ncbi:endo-1,4-beta-xylanase [Phycisphaera mikurensis]|uniref:Beta-xylanase n=1 Tax=Phycisphaera mikurensis (strain NBRC 102666 / KCTC 22515 / FYK2301M01) TaxID=1142394 RepID=I0ICW6_PHYMF|nr:endo-1,4-beta-xylanase [Phycisphaera mikurensis]MBB6442234.1 GH35 family endo-1,4-beta-xylanase [Phycisphaera mikurensis]BAM03104.1 putative glycoside hydrolase [Phycisphaera mikurensis NBRC 102666]